MDYPTAHLQKSFAWKTYDGSTEIHAVRRDNGRLRHSSIEVQGCAWSGGSQPVCEIIVSGIDCPTFSLHQVMTTLIGYARVSTTDQKAELQIDALKAAGCQRVFTDKASGSLTSRPQLDRMLDHLREGDVVVVWRLDRLGRSLKNLIALVEDLADRGVGFRSLSESIDTTTANGKLFFSIMGALAEFERELIRERTMAGLEAAGPGPGRWSAAEDDAGEDQGGAGRCTTRRTTRSRPSPRRSG